jgi:hypothetical protein
MGNTYKSIKFRLSLKDKRQALKFSIKSIFNSLSILDSEKYLYFSCKDKLPSQMDNHYTVSITEVFKCMQP